MEFRKGRCAEEFRNQMIKSFEVKIKENSYEFQSGKSCFLKAVSWKFQPGRKTRVSLQKLFHKIHQASFLFRGFIAALNLGSAREVLET